MYKELEALIWALGDQRHRNSILKLTKVLEKSSMEALLQAAPLQSEDPGEAFVKPPPKGRIWEGFRFFFDQNDPKKGLCRALDLENVYGRRVPEGSSDTSARDELQDVVAVCHPSRADGRKAAADLIKSLLTEWRTNPSA